MKPILAALLALSAALCPALSMPLQAQSFQAFVVTGTQAVQPAATLGSQTSQAAQASVNVDAFAYRVNTLLTLARSGQGLAVSMNQANLLSLSQPSGPENNASFLETFTIPASVINFFYP